MAPRVSKISVELLRVAVMVGDIVGTLVLAIGLFELYALFREELIGQEGELPASQLWSGIGVFLISWFLGSQSQRAYGREVVFDLTRSLRRAFWTWAFSFTLLLFITFGFNVIGGFSRVWLFAWVIMTLVWVLSLRLVANHMIQRALLRGACIETAVAVAVDQNSALRLADSISRASEGRVFVAGVMMLAEAVPVEVLDSVTRSAIDPLIADEQIDRVYIADIDDDPTGVDRLIAHLRMRAVDVFVVPDLSGLSVDLTRIGLLGSTPVVEVSSRPLSSWRALSKRAEDVLLSLFILLLLSPAILLVALAIKIDSPGPVFFRQKRVGFNNRTFNVWKFRSMKHRDRDEIGVQQTSRGDPRITRVGRFIRRTSIDELPQLFNVLAGDMSLVGPRPHAIAMTTMGKSVEAVAEEYAARHRIKPGMTGWAQVNGFRGEVTTEDQLRERVRHDLHYIDNWSLWFDLYILFRTIRIVIADPKAY